MRAAKRTDGQAEFGAPGTAWSDADLEAFLDEALDEDVAAAVGKSLREEPALRARLAAISRADALMTEALSAPASQRAAAGGAGRRWVAMGAAAAACVLLGVGVWAGMSMGSGAAGDGTDRNGAMRGTVIVEARGSGDVGAGEVVREEYDAIPVVLSVKLPARPARGAPARFGGGVPARAGGPTVESQLAGALAAGDVPLAVVLIEGASATAQEGAYRQIGELMRSATLAERVLDSMAPEQQLAACRLWAEDPKLRTVVFPRLALLAEGGEVGPELAAVVGAMSRRDELRPWVRSYGLAAAMERGGAPRG